MPNVPNVVTLGMDSACGASTGALALIPSSFSGSSCFVFFIFIFFSACFLVLFLLSLSVPSSRRETRFLLPKASTPKKALSNGSAQEGAWIFRYFLERTKTERCVFFLAFLLGIQLGKRGTFLLKSLFLR